MKKIISKALCALLTGCILMSFSIPVFAQESETGETSKNIYLLCSDVPETFYDYANETYSNYLDAMLRTENANDNKVDMNVKNYVLGQPFQYIKDGAPLNDAYEFPVLLNNEIKYIYSVYSVDSANGGSKEEQYGCSGTMSVALAKELNTLTEQNITSLDTPGSIEWDDGGVFCKTSEKSVLIESRNIVPNHEEQLSTSNLNATPLHVNNVLEEDSKIASQKSTRDAVPPGQPSWFKFNKSVLTEHQTDKPWCAAYVEAAIIRSQSGRNDLKAYDIVRWVYPNMSEEDLNKNGISLYAVGDYALTVCNMNPSIHHRILNMTEVQTYLNRANRLFMDMSCSYTVQGQVFTYHALMMVGGASYPNGDGFYTVWNPWHDNAYSIMNINNINKWYDGGMYMGWIKTMSNFVVDF